MFLPLYDRNPLKVIPYQFVTIAFIILTVAVFIWQLSLDENGQIGAVLAYGLIPALLFNLSTLSPELAQIPAEVTLLSYLFLHANWWHLLGNIVFLWVFGDNIEDAMGHWRFALFYPLCGALAALAHGIAEHGSPLPLIGASGAVAGVLGAYLMLHPKVKILVLLFKKIPLYLPAYLLIIGWLLFQFFSIAMLSEGSGQVAWWAHIGGFVAGTVLIIPFRDPSIALFDRGIEH